MNINILWSIFIITIILSLLIVILVLVPTLFQLTKTLQALERLTLQWNKDFEPAIKELNEVTAKTNDSLKRIDSGMQIANKLASGLSFGLSVVKNISANGFNPLIKEISAVNAGVKKGLEVWDQGNKKNREK